MATKPYRLTIVLRLDGSDTGTTQQTVTIAAEAADEVVELAQVVRAGLPDEAVISAALTDTAGGVLWSEQHGGALKGAMCRKDQP